MAYTIGDAAKNLQRERQLQASGIPASGQAYTVGMAAKNVSQFKVEEPKKRGLLGAVGEFLAPTTTRTVEKLAEGEQVGGRELLGSALELGSFALPVGAIGRAGIAATKGLGLAGKAIVPLLQKPSTSLLGRAAQTAGEAALSGAAFEAGQAVAGGKGAGEIGMGALAGGALAAPVGAALPFAGRALTKAISYFKPESVSKLQPVIDKEVDDLLSKTRGIINKTQIMVEGRNVPVDKYLKDPHIFSGINVENSRINPDVAVDAVKRRVDMLYKSKSELLPALDRVTPTTPKKVLRDRAIRNLEGTPADIADDVARIDRQINALPDELSLSNIDKFRAQARKSARDTKGVAKVNEYLALEKAARDTIFDLTDNLPFDTNKEFQGLNNEIKNLLGVGEFLDKTLRGQIVKGGRLTNVVGRIIGATAGSQGGFLGSIAGSELGGAIADIITNNQLGSSFKMRLIKNLVDDPEILREAEKFLQKIEQYQFPQLPSPTSEFRTQTFGTKPISMQKEAASTVEKREIERLQSQRSQGIRITPAERSAIQAKTNTTSIIEPNIPQKGTKGKRKTNLGKK